jgi:L-threonylcarbamoyladenylate synthase
MDTLPKLRRIAIDKLLSSPKELSRLRELLDAGGVLAIPTETHYGLAADPSSESGVGRIFAAKGRDDGKPLPVLFGSRNQLAGLGIDAADERVTRYLHIWPAALTVVLPVRASLPASRGSPTLGVRLPASAPLRDLLVALGPLTGTSANRSGEPPLDDPASVERAFAGSIDLLVDGGTTPGGPSSTVLDATREPPVVLRAGAHAWPDV